MISLTAQVFNIFSLSRIERVVKDHRVIFNRLTHDGKCEDECRAQNIGNYLSHFEPPYLRTIKELNILPSRGSNRR